MLDDATEAGEPLEPQLEGASASVRPPSEREQLASAGRRYAEAATLERGAQVGRYLVLGRVGRGGMGEVFAAHDPELDRKVALKLLHLRPNSASADDGVARVRMLREAQAMARLNHPNTAAVHDVGEHQGRVFLAMEFVEGQTLGAWLEQTKRSWREVLAVFIAAGRGLAAAHAAGLIHRDFKPDNVMLTDTGRVLVMDFGLARAGSSEPLDPPATNHESSESADLDATMRAGEDTQRAGLDAETPRPIELSGADPLGSRSRPQLSLALTQAGALLGTPAYMAPEQLRGRQVDARADQWAFCVAFWEALYGQRPFPTTSLAQLITAVVEGRPSPVPRGAKVPAWLHRIVLRGLSREPGERWLSLATLLTELEAVPRRRRRAGLLVAGLTLAGLRGGFALWPEPEVEAPPLCREGVEQIEQVWNDPTKVQVRAALLASKAPYANDTATTVATQLDAWGRAWSAAHRETCEATALRQEQSTELLDQRMRCLNERRRSFAALIANLREHGDQPAVVEDAALRVQSLPDIDRCADVAFVQARIPPPDDPERASAVERIREQLATLAAKPKLERPELAELEQLRVQALELDYPPLLAELDREIGLRRADLGQYDEALAQLRRGYFSARTIGDDVQSITCGIAIVNLLGNTGGRPSEALSFAEHLEPEVYRTGTITDRGDLANARGLAQHTAGDYEAAERSFETAIADSQTAAKAATARLNLGRTLLTRGQWDAARTTLELALGELEHELGVAHPKLALVHDQLGLLESQVGDLEQAERHFKTALAIREAAFGPRHPTLGFSHNNLGRVQIRRDALESALDHFEAALTIWTREFGGEHADVARAHSNIGVVLRKLGRYEAAREHYEQALEVYEAALGPEHDDFAIALHNLAGLVAMLGDAEQAQALETRALAIWTKKLGSKHIFVAHGSIGLADALLQLDDPREAIERAERGLALLADSGARDPELELTGTTTLARAELAAGERDSARDHAERSLELAAEQPNSSDVTLQRARARVVLAALIPARRRELLDAARADYAALPGPLLPEVEALGASASAP